jgi:hypothetical protein
MNTSSETASLPIDDYTTELSDIPVQKKGTLHSPGADQVQEMLLQESCMHEFYENNPTTIKPSPTDTAEDIQCKLNTLRLMKQYAMQN